MKLGLLMKKQEYTHSTPVMDEMFRHLRKYGVAVSTIYPEEHVVELQRVRVENDLYVIRPGIELGLSLAGVLHELGARLINSYPASAVLQDKVLVTHRLIRAGIPTPRSFVTGDVDKTIATIGGERLIIKPHRGSYGIGVRVVDRADEPTPRGGYFAQQFKKPLGPDLKVYVIGDEVFAVRRKFPAESYEDKLGQPCIVDESIRKIALRIGDLFNLQIYGIDVIEHADGFDVIDVNYFPGFVGVPKVAEKLADYLFGCLSDECAIDRSPVFPAQSELAAPTSADASYQSVSLS